ncbi:CBO0543 family protein [Paenibacillus methanolicus]|uniref:Uncharacterized protein n=1 Tax=Paenibacillus methanolicus TaxID=582686 RepID=A0A5S5CBS8_9BACL|nr:CBO0543 family protein [Paenibacillus methanolicus]TYP75453.1 hypothetical protein BCM02_104130 [Paenibacillus methanolicus]
MKQYLHDEIKKIVNATIQANKDYFQLWKEHILFGWQWWLQAILFVGPIAAWLLVRRKDSTDRLLYAGCFCLLATSWLDFIGNSFGLWYYPYKFLPSLPPYVPWETTITVEILLLIQYGSRISPWWSAAALGLFNSFIGEPIAEWLGLYVRLHWRYIYSLPLYAVLYMIAHRISRRQRFGAL